MNVAATTPFLPAETVSAAVLTRRSIRAFLDRPVDGNVLRQAIELAARAPSGGNLQPWRIVAIGGDDLRALKGRIAERLAHDPQPDIPEYPVYPPNLHEPYRTCRYRCGEMMYALLGITREDKAARMRRFQTGNSSFFGAPVALFCYVDRRMGTAQWSDLGMYLQTLMLLLRERGIDSCAQEWWSAYHRTVDDFVRPADGLMLFCGMAIGYADPAAPVNQLVTERLPLEEFATFRGI